MHAALQAEHPHMVVLPTAVAYDLVLEDHVLARQGTKRNQKPFSRELAEMVRYAVGLPIAGVCDIRQAHRR